MNIFKKFLILVKPFWASKQALFSAILLITILVMIFSIVNVQVWLNDWNSDFFNALADLNKDKLMSLLVWFITILVILIFISVNKTWLIKLLVIRWRTWLTHYYLDKWLANKCYYFYSIEHQHQKIDNPDQRIAEDINLLVSKSLELGLGFIQSLGMLTTFIVVLWNISGTLEFRFLGIEWKITGYLVYCVFIFVFINTWLAHLIGKKIRHLNVEKQRNEANFRSALIHQQEYALPIALHHGEERQQKILSNYFSSIKTNWIQLMNQNLKLDYWQTLHLRISSMIPLFLLIPQFLSGVVNIGGLMKARQAFMLVSNNLSWFIYRYDQIAEFAAIIDRLYQFNQIVEKSAQNHIVQNNSVIDVKDLTILTPLNKKLLSGINFTLHQQEWLLLQGHSGIGKTTLLKAISGIWPHYQGVIESPHKIYMATQTTYIPDGSLREVLCYPNDADIYNEAQLANALNTVALSDLITQLDSAHNWRQSLSSGEKQRIGIARILLAKPQWLLLDEITSHLDESLSIALLNKIKDTLPNSGVIYISHQQSLWPLASRAYDLTQYQLKSEQQ